MEGSSFEHIDHDRMTSAPSDRPSCSARRAPYRCMQRTSSRFASKVAQAGITMKKLSETEPLVMLTHLGPENPDIPTEQSPGRDAR
jgi:hypothetical protein